MKLIDLARKQLADFAEPEKSSALAQLEMLSNYRRMVASRSFSESEINEALEDVIQSQDYSEGQLVLVAAFAKPSSTYVDNLCQILSAANLGRMHENVCELLADIADSAAIPFLRQAINQPFEWDQRLEIPRSALAALAEIDTVESWAAITSVANNGPPLLQKVAADLME
jgi:hypothetical protein